MRLTIFALLLASGLSATLAEAQPLRRTLPSYFLFAQRKASLKNLSLDTPCNVGVNCASPNPNSSCGVMALGAVTFVSGSQTASDKAFFRKPGAVVSQLFRNDSSPLANVTVTAPPVETFATPIIPGSCDPGCQPDALALETACGFPAPFPACDDAANVVAVPGADCAGDTSLGNGVCDLPPGIHGFVVVQNKAKITLGAGDYVACGVQIGRNVILRADASRVLVPDGGFFKANNGSTIGEACGDLTVFVQGKGKVSFGRHASVAANVCAPESSVKLGHDNQLLGRFVGDTIASDSNNHGQCCGGACACFNDFTPHIGQVGALVTMIAGCSLDNVLEVRVCGVPAIVVDKSGTELQFTIPNGVAGQECVVEVDSATGTFEGAFILSVQP
jgi:hypothetical protein